MRGDMAADGTVTLSLDPLTQDEAAALNGCRQLAVLLSALDMRYLPRIVRQAHRGRVWEKEDPAFSIEPRLEQFGLTPEALAATAEALLSRASFLDPLGQWYELVRQAHPSTWSEFRGDALLAMDYRIAAEILLRALDELGRTDLSIPPPRRGRMYKSTLDDRLMAEPERLEELLADRELSPRPSVLLVLEGETEMLLMPRVLAEVAGKPVPSTLIELVNMKTIDRDLDMLIRYVAGPKPGQEHGDLVLLTQPPTRVLVAVDPEKRFATKAKQRKERDKLVSRLHESLPRALRSKESLKQLNDFVHVVTWGTTPWEFANFSDAELATAIMKCTPLPSGMTRRDLIAALKAERTVGKTRSGRSPNVEVICRGWPDQFRKLDLAEELWPLLKAKVRRDTASGKRLRVPAARVADRALRMATEFPRRSVALPVR
jgi:hypothetical protein